LYNPAAYNQPTGLTFGDSRRDSLNMPHRTNFDTGLFKHFAMGESTAIEFRAEGFNIVNHPQWKRSQQQFLRFNLQFWNFGLRGGQRLDGVRGHQLPASGGRA
jgi:hypothetical protein